jgi:CheY-like chemotaxis protein
LFVKTDPTALRINGSIELVLLLDSRQGMRVYRLPAIVARLTPDGAGLMFDQYDVSAFRTLVVLLLEQQKHSVTAVKHRRQAVPTVSTEDDDEYVDLVAGGAESSAMDAGAFAPVLQQLSPLYGEPQRKKVPL